MFMINEICASMASAIEKCRAGDFKGASKDVGEAAAAAGVADMPGFERIAERLSEALDVAQGSPTPYGAACTALMSYADMRGDKLPVSIIHTIGFVDGACKASGVKTPSADEVFLDREPTFNVKSVTALSSDALAKQASTYRSLFQSALAKYLREGDDNLIVMRQALVELESKNNDQALCGFYDCAISAISSATGMGQKACLTAFRVIDGTLKSLAEKGTASPTIADYSAMLYLVARNPVEGRSSRMSARHSLSSLLPTKGNGLKTRASKAAVDLFLGLLAECERESAENGWRARNVQVLAGKVEQASSKTSDAGIRALVPVIKRGADLFAKTERADLGVEAAYAFCLLEAYLNGDIRDVDEIASQQIDRMDKIHGGVMISDMREPAMTGRQAFYSEVSASIHTAESAMDKVSSGDTSVFHDAIRSYTEAAEALYFDDEAVNVHELCKAMAGLEVARVGSELVLQAASWLGMATDHLKVGDIESAGTAAASGLALLLGGNVAEAEDLPDLDVDHELIEIFMEESGYVLEDISKQCDILRGALSNNESLVRVRRNFHTLKGSGRMVGLNDFGEVAWHVEKTLNGVLDRKDPFTTAMLDAIVNTVAHMSKWRDIIATGKDAGIDIEGESREFDATASKAPAKAEATPPAPVVESAPEPVMEAAPVEEPEVVVAAKPELAEADSDYVEVSPEIMEILKTEAEDLRAKLGVQIDLLTATANPRITQDLVRPVHTFGSLLASMGMHEIHNGFRDLESFLSDRDGASIPGRVAEMLAGVCRTMVEASMTGRLDMGVLEFELSSMSFLLTPPPSVSEDPVDAGDEPENGGGDEEEEVPAAESAEPALNAASDESVSIEGSVDETDAAEYVDEISIEVDDPSVFEENLAEADSPADEVSPLITVVADQPDVPAPLGEAILVADEVADDIPVFAPAHELEPEVNLSGQEVEPVIAEEAPVADDVPADGAGLSANDSDEPQDEDVAASSAEECPAPAERESVEDVAFVGSVENPEIDSITLDGFDEGIPEIEVVTAENEAIQTDDAEIAESTLGVPEQKTDPEVPVSENIAPEAQETAAVDDIPAESGIGFDGVPSFQAMMNESGVDDDIDQDIFEAVFKEEATRLLEESDAILAAYVSGEVAEADTGLLKRNLHTMKGGARMSGAMKAGQAVHKIESLLDEMIFNRRFGAVEAAGIRFMLSGFSDWLDGGTGVGQVAATGHDAAPKVVIDDVASTMREASKRRVDRDVSEKIGEMLGETVVLQSRMRHELNSAAGFFSELDRGVSRFRGLMREVEAQAELQMRSGSQSESAVAAPEVGEEGGFDALQMDRFTRLHELTRMVSEAAGDIENIRSSIGSNVKESLALLSKMDETGGDIRLAFSKLQMIPLSNLKNRFRKVIRQACADTGKQAEFHMAGDVSVERVVMDRIAAASEHILRNALAHGIEQDRIGAGKSLEGKVSVTVAAHGSEVEIVISDDGKGMDAEAIEEKARRVGIYEPGTDPLDYIFAPGFSTASAVTEISGRGIGMDVVKKEVTDLGGRVSVSSEKGVGSKFTLVVPLSVSTIAALPVQFGRANYAIPISLIDRVFTLKELGLKSIPKDSARLDIHGQSYRLVRFGDSIPEDGGVVIMMRGARVVVHAARAEHGREFISRPLGPQAVSMPGVTGGSISEDGAAVVMVDPVQIARAEASVSSAMRLSDRNEKDSAIKVLVVDDSLVVRTVTRKFLTREGCVAEVAIDGMEALEVIRNGFMPDVILSDIEMPRMDGFEFLRNLKAESSTRAIPVIMISSRAIEKHRDFAIGLGAGSYFGKPYLENELIAEIRKFANRE